MCAVELFNIDSSLRTDSVTLVYFSRTIKNSLCCTAKSVICKRRSVSSTIKLQIVNGVV